MHYVATLLRAWWCGATLLIASCSTSEDLQIRQRLTIERATGATFCSRSNTAILKSLDHSELALSVDPRKCAVWKDPANDATMYAVHFSVSGHTIPAVISIGPGGLGIGSNLPIMIRVVGGPGGIIAPQPRDLATNRLLKRGGLLVTVGYTGTSYRSTYPNPDFDIAASEISYISRQIRRRCPTEAVILIGESLGGMIAAAAVSGDFRGHADLLILLSPLMYSPRMAAENFTRLHHFYESDRRMTIRLVRDGTHDKWSRIYSIDLFDRFFPVNRADEGLIAYLRGANGVPTTIMFGDLDEVIGVDVASQLTASRSIRLLSIRGMNHEITSLQYENLINEIDDEIRHVHRYSGT